MNMFASRILAAFVCALALSACGGGGGGGGGGNSGTSISISPTSVTFSADEGTATPAPVTVRVNFVGDGVVVGYPPGVAVPPWLTITAVGNTNTTADFALSVNGTSNPGTAATTVRFVTGREDGTGIRSVDLPVNFTITAANLSISASTNDLSFAAVASSATPAGQGVNVTFTGDDVAVADVPSWLTVTRTNPGSSPAAFTLTPNTTNFAPQQFVAHVRFVTSHAGSTAQRQAFVAVTYTIAEPYSVNAPPLGFEAVLGNPQGPQPAAGYAISIRGDLAQWHIGAPSFLHLTQTSGTGPAVVTVTADATGMPLGTAGSTLTITDDNSGAITSLPVTFDVRAPRLTVQPASLQFSLDSASLPAALTQTLTISDELGGTQPAQGSSWSVQSISAPWVELSASSGTSAPTSPISVQLDADEVGHLTGGDHSATITLRYSNAAVSNQTLTIPVTLTNHLASVDFVAPYVGLENVAGALVVRGSNFGPAGTQVTIDLGSHQVGPVQTDSDTQVRVSYPALPAGHYPVSIRNQVGVTATNAELFVTASTAFTYQAISSPGAKSRILYDAERQTLMSVDRVGQQILSWEYAGSTWSAASPVIVPDLTDISLAPNGRLLVVLSRGWISDMDLTATPLSVTPRTPNPDPFCGRYIDHAAMTNSGKAFIVFKYSGCSGANQAHLYDLRDHSLGSQFDFAWYLYNGIAVASADGSKVYAGENGLSPEQPVDIFDSLTDTISTGPVNYNLSAVTVSGDASRVILQNEHVYNRTLLLTGHLPSGGMAIVSRDSSKAFVYRDDGDQPRVVVYNLNGALLPGALYPELKTINLADSPSTGSGNYFFTALALTPDDSTLFISGDQRILVVPLN